MAKKRTIVEINGRKYDANTGQIVMDSPSAPQVIDGFKAPIVAAAAPQPKDSRKSNSSADLHRKPQRTNKLHPASVKQTVVPKRVIAKSNSVSRPVQNSNDVKPEPNKAQARQESARLHQQSQHVSRFGPAHFDTANPQPTVAAEVDTPATPAPMPRPVVDRTPPQQPKAEASQPENFEKQPGRLARIRQRRPKLVSVTATAAVVLVLGGYVAYQNIPNMALRLAASRAGFNATLPGYSPSGFAFTGPVAYSEGIVELEYRSNSDGRSFRVIQRESPWDSQSLLNNFVVSSSNEYLTFQERGLTVYIFDGSNATWVDGGIWYTVQGESLLTSEQLLKIAGSL